MPDGKIIDNPHAWVFENNHDNKLAILKKKGEAFILKDMIDSSAWSIEKEVRRIKEDNLKAEQDEAAKAVAAAAASEHDKAAVLATPKKRVAMQTPPTKARRFLR